MTRYYVLTERDGVRVIEAARVDESHPFLVRFVGGKERHEFDRHELLWWSDVAARVPGPFENFGSRVSARERHGQGPGVAWGIMEEMQRETMSHAERSRRSSAAFGALVKAVLAAMPQGWKEGVLDLTVSHDLLADRYRLAHRLRNPATGAEAMDFSESLFVAIEVFHRVEIDCGENWNECVLTLRFRADGGYEAQVERRRGMNFAGR